MRRDLVKCPATRFTVGSGANRARCLDDLKRPGEVHDDPRDLHLRPAASRRIIWRGKRLEIEPLLAREELLVMFDGRADINALRL